MAFNSNKILENPGRKSNGKDNETNSFHRGPTLGLPNKNSGNVRNGKSTNLEVDAHGVTQSVGNEYLKE